MRGRLGFVVLVIFGSFCVYCAQNVVGGGNGGNGGSGSSSGGDGMVGNAGADTCCTPPDPPAGTVLFDQKVTPTIDNGQCVSPAIDVGGNRTLILHCVSALGVQWTFGGAAGWVLPNIPNSQVMVLDGRYGKQLRIFFEYTSTTGTCDTKPVPVTVVGYKQ